MTWLIVGLLVFLVPHSVGLAAPQWRAHQVVRLGEKPWKGLYSLVSLVGFVLIIWGYGQARASPVIVFTPAVRTRHAAA